MKIKKIKEIKTNKPVCIVYARNGHRIYEGFISDIPNYLKEYYVWYKSTNTDYVYIEVTEDKKWMEE